MKRRWVKTIGVVVGLLMVAGLAGGSVTLAQEPPGETLHCGGPRWQGPRFLEVAAQELGMERDALAQRLRDGDLLSDIAEEQGKTLRDLADAFLVTYDGALTEAVRQGYFTQEGAACRLQRLGQRIEWCLSGLAWRRAPWTGIGLETVAELLDMTREALRSELQEGKSLPGLAERQGVELEVISQALEKAREEALLQAVERGRITQERADQARQSAQRRTQSCLIRSGLGGGCFGYPASRKADVSFQLIRSEQPRLQRISTRRHAGISAAGCPAVTVTPRPT